MSPAAARVTPPVVLPTRNPEDPGEDASLRQAATIRSPSTTEMASGFSAQIALRPRAAPISTTSSSTRARGRTDVQMLTGSGRSRSTTIGRPVRQHLRASYVLATSRTVPQTRKYT